MASRLNPYISFDGNAREAMEFYKGIFGGELALSTFGEFGAADGPGGRQDHARPARHDQRLHPHGRRHPAGMRSSTPATTITVSLSGDDADELRGYWEKLSDGGTRLGAAGEADVGRRVRHVHRPVRHRLDGQHQPTDDLAHVHGSSRAASPSSCQRYPSALRRGVRRRRRARDRPPPPAAAGATRPASCQPVTRPSTTRAGRSGPRTRSVQPRRRRCTAPSASAADSSARVTVVPTATTRPPWRRVCLTSRAVAAGTRNGSGQRRLARLQRRHPGVQRRPVPRATPRGRPAR